MSSPPDPIDYGIRPEDNRLGHRAAVALTAVFVLLIALPGLLREFSADAIRDALAQIFHSNDGTVVDRLRAAEKRVDDGAWTKPIRQQVQTVLYAVFREGNRKVLVGRDGWLFHRPGIRALTGRGPVLGPTHSVAKDHALKSWEGPIPVIREFAGQLNERGISLQLVVVSDKAGSRHVRKIEPVSMALARAQIHRASDIYRAVVGPGSTSLGRRVENTFDPKGQLRYLDHNAFFEDIAHSLAGFYYAPRGDRLSGETHPAPSFYRELAQDFVENAKFALGPSQVPTEAPDVRSRDLGDLWRSLDLARGAVHEDLEALATAEAVSDPTSPIVLLGDSNVNMYDDASLPFYMPGAGFGSWLSAYLGRSLHIIAINGGGATTVRQRFAALPDDVVRAKKIVIWVIAERDLFMDPAVARENGVEWKRVTFNPNRSQPADAVPAGAIVVDATLKTKSALQNLADANYPDAVYVAECTVDTVVTGTYARSEVAVVLWNFQQRQIQPSARFAPGQRLRLTLVPWESKGELTKTNLSDDVQRFDLPLLFAEKAEPRDQ